MFGCDFGLFSQAYQIEMVVGFVGRAHGVVIVGAIILVVRHIVESRQLASKTVKTVDSNVDNTFSLIDKVSAKDISTIDSVDLIAYSKIITICILS